MYFQNIPIIYYEFDIGGQAELKVVTDVTANVRIQKFILENITLYDEYDMKEGETPEIVSNKVYGSAFYHWVIMLVNQRYDYLEDFPKPFHVFESYVQEKYGDALYDVHHWVLKGTDLVVTYDPTDPGNPYIFDQVESVTNYDYENDLNESKRRIKLISANLLQSLVTQFKTLV
jgi:hypothetical protein